MLAKLHATIAHIYELFNWLPYTEIYPCERTQTEDTWKA